MNVSSQVINLEDDQTSRASSSVGHSHYQLEARHIAPIMVTKSTAAVLLQMSTTTYDRYVRRGLLPRMNQIGRISIDALHLAAAKLDGIDIEKENSSDAALAEWNKQNGQARTPAR